MRVLIFSQPEPFILVFPPSIPTYSAMLVYANTRRFNVVPWILRGAIFAALLAVFIVAVRSYGGVYLFFEARLGPKTMADYQGLLLKSAELNPNHGRTWLYLSNLNTLEQNHVKAANQLGRAAESYRPWQAMEQRGIIGEHLAAADPGSTESLKHLETVREHYAGVLAVHPNYVQGLARRGRRALRDGNWNLLHEMADRITAIDMNDMNATWLKARAAEEQGDGDAARMLYQKISSAGSYPAESLFTPEEIEQKLTGGIRAPGADQ